MRVVCVPSANGTVSGGVKVPSLDNAAAVPYCAYTSWQR